MRMNIATWARMPSVQVAGQPNPSLRWNRCAPCFHCNSHNALFSFSLNLCSRIYAPHTTECARFPPVDTCSLHVQGIAAATHPPPHPFGAEGGRQGILPAVRPARPYVAAWLTLAEQSAVPSRPPAHPRAESADRPPAHPPLPPARGRLPAVRPARQYSRRSIVSAFPPARAPTRQPPAHPPERVPPDSHPLNPDQPSSRVPLRRSILLRPGSRFPHPPPPWLAFPSAARTPFGLIQPQRLPQRRRSADARGPGAG